MIFALPALVGACLWALPAWAQQHGGHEPALTDLTWYFINFLAFLVILAVLHRATGRPLAAAWQRRWQAVEKDVAQGGNVLADARARLKQAESRIKDVDNAIAEMIRAMREETAREAEALSAAAKRKAEALLMQAHRNAGLERAAAERRVRNEVVDEVVHRAGLELRRRVTVEDDRARRRATIGMLGDWLQ